jgi:zinc and cadmium transporter
MNQVWLYSLLSIALVSLVSLSGILFLIVRKEIFEKVQTILVSFAIGSLLGGAILHLIPESMRDGQNKNAPLFILFSIVAFFILEKYFHFHRHHHPEEKQIKSFGPLNLIADALHNFLDGILIVAAYSTDFNTGVIATVAILAHEIPQEIGDFAVLVQAGYTKKKALIFNLLSALSAFLGGLLLLIVPALGSDFSQFIIPLAAGGFIYIALADLIPELNTPQSVKKAVAQVIAVLLGIAMMWLMLDNHSLVH